MTNKNTFACGDTVVYPTHGVGIIKAMESQEISGYTLDVYVISFDDDRMTLCLPMGKALSSGLRTLCTREQVKTVLQTLSASPKTYKVAWAKKMSECETKINSGVPEAIAEVIRDLHRSASQPDPSYSEKQLYKDALLRLVKEISAVEGLSMAEAQELVERQFPREAA